MTIADHRFVTEVVVEQLNKVRKVSQKVNALRALTSLGGECHRAIEEVARSSLKRAALKDRSPTVREAAVTAIYLIPYLAYEWVTGILKEASKDRSEKVRSRANLFLSLRAEFPPWDSYTTWDLLCEMLSSPIDSQTRLDAIAAVTTLGSEVKLNELICNLARDRSQSIDVRRAATIALALHCQTTARIDAVLETMGDLPAQDARKIFYIIARRYARDHLVKRVEELGLQIPRTVLAPVTARQLELERKR